VAWRHASEEPESRHKRDLVVRSAAVLGNYDYVFDGTFHQDGTIRVSVGATGIAQVHDGPAQRRKPREFDRFLHPVTPQRV
jgi:Cu2+-containing amine oxidase